jgi:hydroxymethylbilane synthase
MTRLAKITLGTRGSELALRQTEMVTALIKGAHPPLEVVREIISTVGDQRQDLRFAEFAAATGGVVDKGIFIKELERALESGQVDAAVHSLKDVPSELEAHFTLPAFLTRANVEDVLISSSPCSGLADLPKGARLGTSSVRRARQIQWMRPDIQVVEIRGNVPTRVRKVTGESALDAVMLAAAGLERLGLLGGERTHIQLPDVALHAHVLNCLEFLPAAGQGAIALECLSSKSEVCEALQPLNDAPTAARVTAEREFLRLLGAGCQTPVGAHTWLEGGQLHMRVRVFSESDPAAAPVEEEDSTAMDSPKTLAMKLAKKVLG